MRIVLIFIQILLLSNFSLTQTVLNNPGKDTVITKFSERSSLDDSTFLNYIIRTSWNIVFQNDGISAFSFSKSKKNQRTVPMGEYLDTIENTISIMFSAASDPMYRMSGTRVVQTTFTYIINDNYFEIKCSKWLEKKPYFIYGYLDKKKYLYIAFSQFKIEDLNEKLSWIKWYKYYSEYHNK